eukprot:3549000-Pyramimonas_sp.AAC.1
MAAPPTVRAPLTFSGNAANSPCFAPPALRQAHLHVVEPFAAMSYLVAIQQSSACFGIRQGGGSNYTCARFPAHVNAARRVARVLSACDIMPITAWGMR